MTKGKKIVLGVVGVIIVGFAVIMAWPRAAAPAFETVAAEKGTVMLSADLTGALTYAETRRVAFLTNGVMQTMHVGVGETVKKDQVLATLDAGLDAVVELKAPIAGVVTEVTVQPGEVVQAGMPVVVVQGPVAMFEVLAQASEHDVATLTEGDAATMTIDAVDAEFVGHVEQIAPVSQSVDGMVTYAVVLSLDAANAEGKGAWSHLRAGMTVDVNVVTNEARNVVYVPRKAVLTRAGKEYVRVADAELQSYTEREVTTGLRGDDNRVVILEGLVEGEDVVVKVLE